MAKNTQNRIPEPKEPIFAPPKVTTERTRTPQEPFSREIEAGLVPHPQNTALGRSAAPQTSLAPPERKSGLSGFFVFPLEALLDLFRGSSSEVFPAQRGWINFRACAARSLWGMPGGLGIASAIEPAGGASPLRGGAGGFESYPQGSNEREKFFMEGTYPPPPSPAR
jgi:hypothetical protein